MIIKHAVSGCIFLIIAASCSKKQGNAQQITAGEYATVVVQAQDTTIVSEYPVTIKGQEDIDIKPRLEGVIDAIYVDEGAVVKKGQKLFLINSPETTQALTSAQQMLVSAGAQLATAQLNVERMRPLSEKGIISPVQLQTYENAYQSAIATQKQAQAQVTSAQAMSSWLTISSPVDGVVGTIPYRQGSLATTATVLTTVANTENVYAYFSLNEKNLAELLNRLQGNTTAEKIQNIPAVTLVQADGTVYPEKGKVETISGVMNSTTGSANLRAKFPNNKGALRSGTSGKVEIPQPLHNVIIIPQRATFDIQDKVLVYKVEGDSVVQKTIEVIPVTGGQDYAVTSGLNANDRIVADGVATLSNGRKIVIK